MRQLPMAVLAALVARTVVTNPGLAVGVRCRRHGEGGGAPAALMSWVMGTRAFHS